MGLDLQDLPEGEEDFPDAAYQTPPRRSADIRAQSSLDAEPPDRLPNSRTRIPDNRADMLDLLEQCEAQLVAMDGEVQRLSGLVEEARRVRDVAYEKRQERRQDVRVLRMRIRDTMPLEFDDNGRADQ